MSAGGQALAGFGAGEKAGKGDRMEVSFVQRDASSAGVGGKGIQLKKRSQPKERELRTEIGPVVARGKYS